MTCPVCLKDHSKPKFIINGCKIVECKSCSHAFAEVLATVDSVDRIYSDKYFFGGENGYIDYTLEGNILIARGEKYADIISNYLKTGSLLDIGAAAGFIMKGFENKGWEVSGVEPNSSMVNYGKKELGLDIKVGTIESAIFDIEADLVTLIQVIAHLYDINSSINSINSILKAGGYVLIETWNKDSLSARILAQNWHEYSPPSTINFFSKKTLYLLMKRYGFLKISSGKPSKNPFCTRKVSIAI